MGAWQPPPMPPQFGPPYGAPGGGWGGPPRRSRWGTVLRVIGVVVLVISLLLNVILFGTVAVLGTHAGENVRETTLVAGDNDQKIAVVPIVNEMILQKQADQLTHLLDAAEKDMDVKAVVLQIDTPGGGVTAADEMHQRIMDFKVKRPTVPVIVTMGSVAASGGYYAAAPADFIFAQPTTITGSIGVLMPQYNASRFAQKYGIEDTSLHATGTPYKTAGSWLKPPTTQESDYFVHLLDSDFAQFKQVVVSGRGSRLKMPIEQIANGKAYTAQDALAMGLVDQIGYPADAYAYAARAAKLSHMMVVRYEEPSSLAELLTSRWGGVAPSASLRINGVDVSANLEALLTPKMLYLWRGN